MTVGSKRRRWRVVELLAKRLAIAASTLLLISVITFLATNAVPANPAQVALGKLASPQEIAQYTKQEGLDKPVVQRYFQWLGNYLEGNWGKSVLANQLSVRHEVVPRIERSLILGGTAMAIAITLAFLLGVWTGLRSSGVADLAISGITLLFNAVPEFVTALLVLVIFAVELQWLPIQSAEGILYGNGFGDEVRAYALPVLTLVLVLTPYMTRMVRTNVRETRNELFVRSAVLRGLPRRTVVWRYIVPSARIPVIAVIALTLADIVAGVVIVETVYAFPGIGELFVQSVLSKDIPVVQAVALVIGTAFITLNVIADGLLVAADPRLRTRG